MRIVYHHRTRATDAQKVHITEIVKAFRDLGHSVEMVSLVPTEQTSADPSKEAGQAGWQVLVRRIPFVYEVVQLGYNAIGIPLLFWKVLQSSPDFIYERYSLFNFTGVFVAKLLNKPIVLEVNSPFALEQGRDGHIRAVGFANWTERIICNAANTVIVVTGSLRKIMAANGIRPEKLAVMSIGVYLSHFRTRPDSEALRQRLGLDGKVVIGFVGWFRNWHGLDVLIEAFHRAGLAARGAALLLVGDGPAMKQIREQIERLRTSESVILTGALPHEVVPEYLDLIDIAVQPAANEYCCPMKILEYMALSKPVVAPRQENIQELLREDEEAVFFRPGDSEALGIALSGLVSDPPRVKRLGERARSAIDKRGFLWINNAERVTQLVGKDKPS
jgi:glycosyltransferase involved in cell wall biosynthesis